MQGIDKSQLQRLEQESARFTNEIKQKENENKQLKQEIDKIKRQLKESKKTYDEIAKVSTFKYILIHTSFPSHYSTIQYKTVDSIEFQGRTTAADQQLKMKRIMSNSKLVTSNGERAKEIMEMRAQLKKLAFPPPITRIIFFLVSIFNCLHLKKHDQVFSFFWSGLAQKLNV